MQEKTTSNKQPHENCTSCRWDGRCNNRHTSSEDKIINCNLKVPYANVDEGGDVLEPEWFTVLKQDNRPTKMQKLATSAVKESFYYKDLLRCSYSLYVNFINDTLDELRKGKSAIAFYDYQIRELLRFEPNLRLCEFDGVLYIWLETLESKFQ